MGKIEDETEISRLVAAQIFNQPFKKPECGECCTCQGCGYGYDDCQCEWATTDRAMARLISFLNVSARTHHGQQLYFRLELASDVWYVRLQSAIGGAEASSRTGAPMAVALAALRYHRLLNGGDSVDAHDI